jgi:dolichol-phosphate mannosyltransferase
VIDDNSPDGTGQWCERKSREDPRVRCLHRAGKLGLGTAMLAGMKYAVEHGYRYVLTIDADLSHPPKYIPAMLAGMTPQAGAPVDVMIGSRYVPGGGTQGWPLKRQLMSRAVNLYARWLLGLRPKDCSGGFRCYRAEMLAKLDFAPIRSQGYSVTEEILWRVKRLGARIDETPIVFVERHRGKSKINVREIVGALWTILTLGLRGMLGR